MPHHVRKAIIIVSILIAIFAVLLLPVTPLAAISFECGLLVGILLHSAHTASGLESGELVRKT